MTFRLMYCLLLHLGWCIPAEQCCLNSSLLYMTLLKHTMHHACLHYAWCLKGNINRIPDTPSWETSVLQGRTRYLSVSLASPTLLRQCNSFRNWCLKFQSENIEVLKMSEQEVTGENAWLKSVVYYKTLSVSTFSINIQLTWNTLCKGTFCLLQHVYSRKKKVLKIYEGCIPELEDKWTSFFPWMVLGKKMQMLEVGEALC